MINSKNIPIGKGHRWKTLLEELHETLQRDDRRFEIIQEIDRHIQKTTDDPDSMFMFLLPLGLKEVKADYGHIMIRLDSDYLEVKYSITRNDEGRKVPIKSSLCGNVFTNGKTFRINDVTKRGENSYFPLHNDTKCELALPIQDSRKVKVYGILNIEWKHKNQISDENLNFCNLLNSQIAVAMEQIKLWQGVRLISELSNNLLVNITSPKEVYESILKRVLSILDFKMGQILLVNGDELIIVASSNDMDVNVVVDKNSICGDYIFVKKGKSPLNIPDVFIREYEDKYQWYLGHNIEDGIKMRSELVVPLIGNEDNTIGVINIEDPQVNAFSEFDEFIIKIFGKMIANAIEAANERKRNQSMKNARDFGSRLAEEGYRSVGFMHNFGGNIGNARARLAEFKREILPIRDMLPNFSGVSSIDFLEDILQNLRDATDQMEHFRKKMESIEVSYGKKIEDASITDDKISIDLIEAITNAIQRAKSKTGNNFVSITFVKDNSIGNKPSIDVQLTDQFDEVLDCLINNAIEAMPPNGGKIQIIVSLKELLIAEVSISDTGMGMNNETLKQIFDLGFTTKKNLTMRLGEGLGLWFVKSYLNAFGSDILVLNSEPQKGTTFLLKIPIKLKSHE